MYSTAPNLQRENRELKQWQLHLRGYVSKDNKLIPLQIKQKDKKLKQPKDFS